MTVHSFVQIFLRVEMSQPSPNEVFRYAFHGSCRRLSAGVGYYNVVYGYTAFGTGWGDTVGAKSLFNLGDRDRMDNTVTYVTPKFGGLYRLRTVLLQR